MQDEDDDSKRFRRRRNEWLVSKGKAPGAPVEPETPRPDLYEDLEHLWNDWQTMSTARPVGMSACGIPWSEFSTYASDHGVDGPERLRFCRLMMHLDSAFLTEMSRQREAKRSGVNNPRDQGRLDQPTEGGEGRGPGA